MEKLSLFGVIRRSPYRGFFVGEGFQVFGIAAGTTGFVIQVAAETGNAALSVAVMAAPGLAAVGLSPLVKPILKRFGFYRSLVGTYLVAFAVVLAVMLATVGTMAWAALAIALMFFLGGVNTIHTPAVFATLSWLVGESHLSKAISSTQLRTGIAWVVGPVVGASLVGVANGRLLLGLVAATYVVALIPYLANRQLFRKQQAQLLAEMDKKPEAMTSSMGTAVAEYQESNRCQTCVAPSPGAWGFLSLLRNRLFAFVVTIALILNLVLGMFATLTGAWLVIDVGVAMAATGTFYTVRALASLPGVVVVDWAQDRFGISRSLLVFAALISGGALIAAAGMAWLPLAYVGTALFGFAYYAARDGLTGNLITFVFGKSLRVEAQTLFSFFKGISGLIFIGVAVVADFVGITNVIVVSALLGIGLMLFLRFGMAKTWKQMVAIYNGEANASEESAQG